KSTSGICRRDKRDGSFMLLPLPFFIASPLVSRRSARTDDPDPVLGQLHKDGDQHPLLFGLPDQNGSIAIQGVLYDESQRICEHRHGLEEGDAVLLQIGCRLLRIPYERHKCNTLKLRQQALTPALLPNSRARAAPSQNNPVVGVPAPSGQSAKRI